jgi:hypothetical protein
MDALETTTALGWLQATAKWVRSGLGDKSREPRIGLALGGVCQRDRAHWRFACP